MRARPYRSSAHDGGQVRTALVLAAGVGARLAPLTYALPKCLVTVSGMPIIGRLLRALDHQKGGSRAAIRPRTNARRLGRIQLW